MRTEKTFGTEIYGKLIELQEIANQSGHLCIHEPETAIDTAHDIVEMVSAKPQLSILNLDKEIRDSIRRYLQERNGDYSGVDVIVVKWMAYAALKFADHKSEEMKKYLMGYRKRLENELLRMWEEDEEEGERFSFVADMKRVIDGDDNEYPILPVGESSVSYPEITKTSTDFFEENFFTDEKGKDGKKLKRKVPVEWILHTIYDTTKEWNPKAENPRQWRILYEVLLCRKYFIVEKRPIYTKYVRAVVKYCFPDTKATYSNNLSKVDLGGDYKDWTAEDKDLYEKLNVALTAPRT